MRLSFRLVIKTIWDQKRWKDNLLQKILDEYMKGFRERNPTLRVFCCSSGLPDEATPHLHIDFIPYVKGK